MEEAFRRVGTRITRGCFNVTDLGYRPVPMMYPYAVAEELGCSNYGKDENDNFKHFFGLLANSDNFMEALTEIWAEISAEMAALKADYGQLSDRQLRIDENAVTRIREFFWYFYSYHPFYDDVISDNAATIEFLRSTLNAFEDVRNLMLTQIKIMIERELGRESEWKAAIPEPYLSIWYDYAVCVDNCPIPLPWTSWSCHCKKGSELSLLLGDDSNPDGLPECDCQKQKRYRVQVCRDNNHNYDDDYQNDGTKNYQNDGNCRDTENADEITQDNCLSCNIYHENLWNGDAPLDVADRYEQKLECKNYGWSAPWTDENDRPEEDDAASYKGLNMRRVFYASERQF